MHGCAHTFTRTWVGKPGRLSFPKHPVKSRPTKASVWVLPSVSQKFCSMEEVTGQSDSSRVWFRSIGTVRWECVPHSQVLTGRLEQMRETWRPREMESRVTSCLCQQKPHMLLQNPGSIHSKCIMMDSLLSWHQSGSVLNSGLAWSPSVDRDPWSAGVTINLAHSTSEAYIPGLRDGTTGLQVQGSHWEVAQLEEGFR